MLENMEKMQKGYKCTYAKMRNVHKKFPEKYTYNAYKPGVKDQIFDLTVNGNGTRAIGRILNIAPNTVTSALKKEDSIAQIN